MYQTPQYTPSVSLKLSEVLADVGVNERMILKWRRSHLLRESLVSFMYEANDVNGQIYFFGSRSEGTTTLGICSDLDVLHCFNGLVVIQDLGDWTPGIPNLLMVQDNSVTPGYCLLQALRLDAPLPDTGESDQCYVKDRTGKVLLKSSADLKFSQEDESRHGPASSLKGKPGYYDTDHVFSFHCKTWPQQARQWLDQQGEGQWPSPEMKQYCSRTGCLVVPVGSRGSDNEELEWRISTSLAERCLMFNLNITQLRCYVLMKMIVKTFIDPQYKDVISSYMCKTVLFHCVANSLWNIWRENNLLSCLSLCLQRLHASVSNENCPHFIIPGNNLMRGKISPAVKPLILEQLNQIISWEGMALLGIKCDGLGNRLYLKFYNLSLGPCNKTCDIISGQILINFATTLATIPIGKYRTPEETVQRLKSTILRILRIQHEGQEYKPFLYLVKCLCTALGSVLASININKNNTVSLDALKIILFGLNTEVASSKLKLASILYCVQEIQIADLVLCEIERGYDPQIVEPVCMCFKHDVTPLRPGFNAISANHDEDAIQYATASCVRFQSCEMHCVPNELKYEMFRSTQEDNVFRTAIDKDWMDDAAVDSLPYLYFLQYKVNNHLGRHGDKHDALLKLLRTIIKEPNLGHRETALNLLGKCMEQEGRAITALQCYSLSLRERGRNNAAKIHICTLLSELVNARAKK
jgi:hypothetical protein